MPPSVAPGDYLDSPPSPKVVQASVEFSAAGPAATLHSPPQPSFGSESAQLPRNETLSADNERLPDENPGATALNSRQLERLTVPEGMDAWVRDNLENPPSPSGEIPTPPLIPPQDPGVFFNEAWEGLAPHAESQDKDLYASNSSSISSLTTITQPFPVAVSTPRSSTLYGGMGSDMLGRLRTLPDPSNEVATWATHAPDAELQEEPKRSICTRRDCPMAAIYHLEGIYVHNGAPALDPLGVFGKSNPPPFIYEAVQRGCHWGGTQADADLISRFIAYHGVGGDYLTMPHTNFLWGEEVNTPQAVPGAPVVRLPFPAIPMRIHFDVSLNLPIPFNAPVGSVILRRCIDPSCQVVGDHSVHQT
ncbi:MAG: hypothetical protein LQ341_001669 [Variospora aurantia]|nr:MAG: hypothetical protein LQ341_001669 [Variospora aurantia]